jgi:ABC-type multidrug transport system fused ATPase/permease subunit
MNDFQQRYYKFWTRLFNYEKRIDLIPVNFNKPWWTIIWQQKFICLALFITLGAINIFDSTIMVLIARSLEVQDFNMLVIIVLVRVLLIAVLIFVMTWNPILQLTAMKSVFFSANKRLLEVDPISHSTKSSGVIVSKINKGSDAYENLLDIITFDLYLIAASIFGSILLLLSYSIKIGLVASLMIVLMAGFSIFWSTSNAKLFKPIRIKSEDTISQISIETLQQTNYIRSVFGTNEQLELLDKSVNDFVVKEATSWETDGMGYHFLRIVFFLSVLVISIMILDEVRSGNMTTAVGIGLITSYFVSSSNIRSIGSNVRRFSESHFRIVDLFEFMRTFGKQTYPVLDEKKNVK